jgi:hypothetical protein
MKRVIALLEELKYEYGNLSDEIESAIRILKEYGLDEDNEVDIYYLEDCKRIKEIFKERGEYITLQQAEKMWQHFSNLMCAGWMMLPEDDDEVYLAAKRYK